MMKLTLAEPTYLKESISIISDLVNEGRFKIEQNGIELVAMDPANVAMVIFKLLASVFTEYNIKENLEIAINLNNLKQILRRAGSNDTVTLEMEDKNKLKILLKGHSIRRFSLPIIELEEKEQKIPDLKFPVTIQTASHILNEAIADAEIVADSVSLEVEPKKFNVSAEGDLNQAYIEIRESDLTKINAAGKAKAKYSIEYLKKMINASRLAEEVVIQFNNDYPLKLDYKVVDRLMLSFILAPRVENE